jgi:hypothetical protein
MKPFRKLIPIFMLALSLLLLAGAAVAVQTVRTSPLATWLLNPPSAKGNDVAMEEIVLAVDSHDRYANLEVSYFRNASGKPVSSGLIALKAGSRLKAKGRFVGKGQWEQTPAGRVWVAEGQIVFEPNHEPLWARIVGK